jgi:hypothetical protein
MHRANPLDPGGCRLGPRGAVGPGAATPVHRDRGSATVEIAVALPALVVMLGAVLTLGSAGAAQLSCSDGARAGAREAALGSADRDVIAVARTVAGGRATVDVVHDGGWVRVRVRRSVVPWRGLGASGDSLQAVATSTARVEP